MEEELFKYSNIIIQVAIPE